jgi:hypothetical protein
LGSEETPLALAFGQVLRVKFADALPPAIGREQSPSHVTFVTTPFAAVLKSFNNIQVMYSYSSFLKYRFSPLFVIV